MPSKHDARAWLREQGYQDVADQIDDIMAEWAAAGNRTRRNWWDILAGDKQGRPRVVAGRIFPVLRAAQERQHRNVMAGALSSPGEKNPVAWRSNRWTASRSS